MTKDTENQEAQKEVEFDEPEEVTDTSPEAELAHLKTKAERLGVKFSNNIGLDALRKRVKDAMSDEKPEPEKAETKTKKSAGGEESKLTPNQVKAAHRKKLMEREMKLVRLRIANLNPHKRDLGGEIFTVVNRIIGTVRKFVPYGEATDNGYHVPHIIYKQLKSRKFLSITTKRDRRTGQEEVIQRWVPEFSLEVLEPLTQDQLNKLAASQAASRGADDGF